jgi:hypothetical protein
VSVCYSAFDVSDLECFYCGEWDIMRDYNLNNLWLLIPSSC